jgi:hypothetical protein
VGLVAKSSKVDRIDMQVNHLLLRLITRSLPGNSLNGIPGLFLTPATDRVSLALRYDRPQRTGRNAPRLNGRIVT